MVILDITTVAASILAEDLFRFFSSENTVKMKNVLIYFTELNEKLNAAKSGRNTVVIFITAISNSKFIG